MGGSEGAGRFCEGAGRALEIAGRALDKTGRAFEGAMRASEGAEWATKQKITNHLTQTTQITPSRGLRVGAVTGDVLWSLMNLAE